MVPEAGDGNSSWLSPTSKWHGPVCGCVLIPRLGHPGEAWAVTPRGKRCACTLHMDTCILQEMKCLLPDAGEELTFLPPHGS